MPLFLVLGCGGADGDDLAVAASQEALAVPGLTPVPCEEDDEENWAITWDESETQLQLLDAFFSCASGVDTLLTQSMLAPEDIADRALGEAFANMRAIGIGPTEWFRMRTAPSGKKSNCSPGGDPNQEPNRGSVPLERTSVQESMFMDSSLLGKNYWLLAANSGFGDYEITKSRVLLANWQLRAPGLNLCMSQILRQRAPGASGAEAILLSSESQLALLDSARTRSQIAITHYALLASVFAAEPQEIQSYLKKDLFDSDLKDYQIPGWDDTIALLQDWSRNVDPAVLQQMGEDFAAAVQMHTAITEEFSTLLSRSSSARLARGGTPDTLAQEYWGKGSWLQRLGALMYGGDPLAMEKSGPWRSSSGLTGPGETVSGYSMGWPDLPFIDLDVREPEVHAIIEILKSFGDIRLSATSDDTGRLYDDAEVAIRTLYCLGGKDSHGECQPGPLPTSDLDYLLAQRELDRDHARRAEALLREMVGERLHTEFGPWTGGYGGGGYNYYRPLTPSGAYNVVGPAWRDETGDVIIRGTSLLVPKRPTEFMGSFGRYAPQFLAPPALIDSLSPDSYIDLNATPPLASHAVGLSTQHGCLSWLQGAFNVINGTAGGTISSYWVYSIECLEELPAGHGAELHRRFGAVAALSAVRDVVSQTEAYLANVSNDSKRTALLGNYLAHAPGFLDVAAGYAGTSFALTPQVEAQSYEQANATDREITPFLLARDDDGRERWNVTVVPEDGDLFWHGLSGEQYRVFLVEGDTLLSNLVEWPQTRVLRRGLGNVLDELTESDDFTVLTKDAASGILSGTLSLDVDPGPWTLFVWKATDAQQGATFISAGNCSEGAVGDFGECIATVSGEVRLIADRIQLPTIAHPGGGPTFLPTAAQYFGGATGLFNQDVEEAWMPDPLNPGRPQKDGFGFDYNWVPPLDARLIGGNPGEPSFRVYLDAARTTATEAAGAVSRAMTSLLEQERDDKTLEAEQTKKLAAMEAVSKGLCGTNNPSCEVEMVKTKLLFEWNRARGEFRQHLPGRELHWCGTDRYSNDDDATAGLFDLDCVGLNVVETYRQAEFYFPEPILASLSKKSPPTFDEYSGGEMQQAFLNLWEAVKIADEQMRALFASVANAQAQIVTARTSLEGTSDLLAQECEFWDKMGSRATSALAYAGLGASIGSLFPGPGTAIGAVAGFVIGLFISNDQEEFCEGVAAELRVKAVQLRTTIDQSLFGVQITSQGVLQQRVTMVRLGAAVARLVSAAKIAKDKLALESALADAGNRTSFGLYRRYHAYDIIRARALLENARVYSLAARRAIESYFAVNLNDLTEPEPFVAAPARWADEVYTYDLSLPAAVGLSVSTPGDTVAGGIYGNRLVDYTRSLEAFVDGFAVERPASVVAEDLHTIDIPGPAPIVVSFGEGEDAEFAGVGWQVKCGASETTSHWQTLSDPSEPCITGQAYAIRTWIKLDPWGRLANTIDKPPFSNRHNTRWTRLAVALIGEALRECPPNDFDCAATTYARYTLRQTGPSVVSDYSGAWRFSNVDDAVIEGGKAAAVERPIDLLARGWGGEYLGAIARSELSFRPVAGNYEFVLEVDPSLRLDKLERVTLFAGTSYWTKQN